MTRRGVEYNLKVSPYKLTTENGVMFVFSSQNHLNAFISRQEENRKRINESLSNRFNFYLEFNLLADCVLYRRIEQRGFLILKDGEPYQWENIIKFVGEKLTKKNSQD